MSVPKAKALLTVCAALLLCGGGQALSEREIVRAVFFARQQGHTPHVCCWPIRTQRVTACSTKPCLPAGTPPRRRST